MIPSFLNTSSSAAKGIKKYSSQDNSALQTQYLMFVAVQGFNLKLHKYKERKRIMKMILRKMGMFRTYEGI